MKQQSSRVLRGKVLLSQPLRSITWKLHLGICIEYHSSNFMLFPTHWLTTHFSKTNVKLCFYLYFTYPKSTFHLIIEKKTTCIPRKWQIDKPIPCYFSFYSLCRGRFLRYRRVIVVCRMAQCRTRSLHSRMGPAWLAWRFSLIMRATSC